MKKIKDWKDTDRNIIANAVRNTADLLNDATFAGDTDDALKALYVDYLRDLALAVDNN